MKSIRTYLLFKVQLLRAGFWTKLDFIEGGAREHATHWYMLGVTVTAG